MATADPKWNVAKLAELNPNHPLALANATKAGPSDTTTGSGGEITSATSSVSIGTGTGSVSAAHAKTVITQLERGAKSDEARTICEEMMKSLGLN